MYLQGKRPMAKDNISLGVFHLDEIPPAPRGVPQIEIKFNIDANGIVNVTAKDLGTGKSQSITITGNSKLSEEEIRKKVEDAKTYAEEDKKVREMIEIRNKGDSLAYQTEKMMKDYADKLDDDLKTNLQEDVDALKEALKGDDPEDIKEKTSKLETDAQKLGEQVYKQSQQQGAANAAQQAASGFRRRTWRLPWGFPGGNEENPIILGSAMQVVPPMIEDLLEEKQKRQESCRCRLGR